MARPTLTKHRKFARLGRSLGSMMLARGALEMLWEVAYESGDDYLGTSGDIEHTVGWTGEPGTLTAALVACGAPEGQGFIDPIPGQGETTYRVHDLWHHAPDYVRKRQKREADRRQKSIPVQADRRTADTDRKTADTDRQLPTGQTVVDRTPAPAPALSTPQPPYGGPSEVHSPKTSSPRGAVLTADDAAADLAGEFLRRYPVVYARARNGAFYPGKPVRDFTYAMNLVKAWSDLDYLEKMAELFLRCDDWRHKYTPGSVGQFANMAPECDATLRREGILPRGEVRAS